MPDPRRPGLLLAAVLVALVALAFGLTLWPGDPSPGTRGAVGSTESAETKLTRVHSSAVPSDEPSRTEVAAPPLPLIEPSELAHGVVGRLLQDGRGIAGAEVRALDVPWPQEEVARATTAADGKFALPLPAGRYHLMVKGDGIPHGFGLHLVEVPRERLRHLGDVVVPRGAAVRGRFLDEEGQPIVGGRVRGSGLETRIQVNRASREPDPAVETGSDGRFVIGNLWPGPLTVRVECPDHQSRFVDLKVGPGACGDVGDIVLRKAYALPGVVVDQQDRPIAGARVTPGGGMDSEPHVEEAVVTDDAGAFVLRGFFGNRSELRFDCPGFETEVCQCFERPAGPMRMVLRPALELTGTVSGTSGHPGLLHLADDPQNYRSQPLWVYEIFRTPHPIAADGSFRVTGLPAGRWLVRASIPGVGSVAPVAFELPQQAPLELSPVVDLQVAVTVVDDVGAPVPDATLVREPVTDTFSYGEDRTAGSVWLHSPTRVKHIVDRSGVAIVRVPPQERLQLAAIAPGHLIGAVAVRAGSVPPAVTVVVPRGGLVHGSMADPGITAHVRAYVGCALADAPDKAVGGMAVDSRGQFCSSLLLPGSYRVTLHLLRGSSFADCDVPSSAPMPLLGDYAPVGEGVVVEVTAGGDAAVQFPAPRCGEVAGSVFAGGVPVPDAIVFGCKEGERSDYVKLEALDAFTSYSHCTTDADGRFRFLVSVDSTFELRARHRDGAAWCDPIVLRVSPAATVRCDIRLNAAAIRGSFDSDQVPIADREFLTARLYRLQDATEDPFFSSSWMLSLPRSSQVKQVPVAKTGTFAFECLPAGGYVLRLVTPMDRILMQRVLHTVGDEVLDLGKLEVPKSVIPQLGCGLSAELRVWVRQAVEGSDGVFVREAYRGLDGVFLWGKLEPGNYRLQACVPSTFDIPEAPVEAVGQPVDVEVHADGTCTPAIVWPGGVAK
jgi:hypothetical protein